MALSIPSPLKNLLLRFLKYLVVEEAEKIITKKKDS